VIRDFNIKDLELIDTNEFSDLELYKDFLGVLNLKTMIKDDKIVCILGYLNYWGNNYKVFLSLSNDFKWSREVKEYIYALIKELKAERIETESPDNEKLNRWHEFLGFTKEGTKRKFMDNKDYNVWGIVWQQE